MDNSFSGVGADTCDVIGSVGRPSGVNPMKEWFNTAAFTTNAIGTFGNAGRNSLRRPNYYNIDSAVLKRMRFERYTAELRLEAFNVFNHPNWDLFYNTGTYTAQETVTSPTFGQVTHASDPRLLQVSLKLRYAEPDDVAVCGIELQVEGSRMEVCNLTAQRAVEFHNQLPPPSPFMTAR